MASKHEAIIPHPPARNPLRFWPADFLHTTQLKWPKHSLTTADPRSRPLHFLPASVRPNFAIERTTSRARNGPLLQRRCVRQRVTCDGYGSIFRRADRSRETRTGNPSKGCAGSANRNLAQPPYRVSRHRIGKAHHASLVRFATTRIAAINGRACCDDANDRGVADFATSLCARNKRAVSGAYTYG